MKFSKKVHGKSELVKPYSSQKPLYQSNLIIFHKLLKTINLLII